jgi:endonuclease/exonuclease/phosphatase family metal-dependent hydrolase
MDEIHQVVNAGIKVGPLGFPSNLKEGLVILARPELSVRKVKTWKLSGGAGFHSDILTFHTSKAVMALTAAINVNGNLVNLVNIHLVAAPRYPIDADDIRTAILTEGKMSTSGFNRALEKWRRRTDRRMDEIRHLLLHLAGLPSGRPSIIAGDFNAAPGSADMRLFHEQSGYTEVMLFKDISDGRIESADTWDVDHNENTAFSCRSIDARGKARKGFDYLVSVAGNEHRRLDYIFLSPDIPEHDIVYGHVVLKDKVGGIQASDHFGVMAEFMIR